MGNTNVAAILFDLDGTLVDSIPAWLDANVQALADIGVQMDTQTFLKDFYHEGLHFEGILEKLSVDPKLNETFYTQRDDLFEDFIRKDIEWIDGSEETLQYCCDRYPVGMMTGSRRRFIDAMDERLKLSRFFSAIVTRDDTGVKMKPDPYGLLMLAEHIGVKPQDCLYVGDQPVDVQAARKAGMQSCHVHWKQSPEQAEQGSDFVIDKISDVQKIV